MSSPGGPESETQTPGAEILSALYDAQQSVMPGFTAELLASLLGLEEDEPDNLTLVDRLTGGDVNNGTLRQIVYLVYDVDVLIEATNERRANPAEESIAGAWPCHT